MTIHHREWKWTQTKNGAHWVKQQIEDEKAEAEEETK